MNGPIASELKIYRQPLHPPTQIGVQKRAGEIETNRAGCTLQGPQLVKDYQMPACEQGLADCLGIRGRRRIILRGGNRGDVAVAFDKCRVSYGDLKSICLICSDRNDSNVSQKS